MVRVVEEGTGRLLGTVEPAAAHATVHEGAVYVHQGATYVVRSFDLAESVALAVPALVDHSTHAREASDLRVLSVEETQRWGPVGLHLGTVEVTAQVVSFLRRRHLTGEVLGETPLDLPARTLETSAVWWTLPAEVLAEAGLREADVPGAAHAVEHAAIGLLPLHAGCDRWDVGGLSAPLHPDTGCATVFVHDGHPGGAGFAERGYRVAGAWWAATAGLLRSCQCPDGCPSCVQSPKCGNGNEPLDKGGALRLLEAVLAGAPDQAASA
jgi:DEAD/DEAH box helicase domain-containing protein